MSLKSSWSRVALFVLLGLSACTEEKKPPPAPAPVAEAKWNVNKELSQLIQQLAKTCKVDTQRVTVTCTDGRKRTIVQEFLTDKRSRGDNLETFAALLEEKDQVLVSVVSSLLYDITRSGLGQKVDVSSVTPKVARAFREQFIQKTGPQSRLLAPVVAHTAAISGQLGELDAAIDKKPQLQSTAYRYTMVHGRLKAFEKVQQLVLHERSAVRLAALEAPRNMRKWTPKDRASICPWAESLLSDQRPMVSSRAATLLSRCSGASVDKLLDRGEAAAKAGEFGRGLLPAYRDLCSGMRRRSGGGATKKQCERNRQLLQGVAEDKKSKGQARALVLSAIAYQWPDEESLKLAKKLGQSREAELSRMAEQIVQRLERRREAERRGAHSPRVPGASQKKPSPVRKKSGSLPNDAPGVPTTSKARSPQK